MTPYVCEVAASSGNVEALKLAKELGVRIPSGLYMAAYHQVEVLKWIHQEGIDWNPYETYSNVLEMIIGTNRIGDKREKQYIEVRDWIKSLIPDVEDKARSYQNNYYS